MGVDVRVLLLTLLLRDTVVDEFVPVETELLRVVRVVAALPLNVLALRPVVLFASTDERVERLVLLVFDTAALVELREVALLLNDVLRPVVAVVVLRLETGEVLRDEVTAELRPLTVDVVG